MSTQHVTKNPLSILDRYLLGEMAGPFTFALIAFTSFLLVNSFFLAADYLVNKGIPFSEAARYVVLQVPSFMYVILPFAGMVGVLLGFSRLVGDNEVAALRTSGVALSRIAIPCYACGVALTIAAFCINEYVAPRSYAAADATFRQIAYHATEPLIEADRFTRTPDGRYVIHVGSIDHRTGMLTTVQIWTLAGGKYASSLIAASGIQRNGVITLHDGVETTYASDGTPAMSTRFAALEFPLRDAGLLDSTQDSPFAMNSHQLAAQISALHAGGQDTRDLEGQLQMKYAMPAACLVAVFIALPLAVRFGRRGRGTAAMTSVIVMFVYWALQAAAIALGKNGAIPVALATWTPNLVFLTVGTWLLANGNRT